MCDRPPWPACSIPGAPSALAASVRACLVAAATRPRTGGARAQGAHRAARRLRLFGADRGSGVRAARRLRTRRSAASCCSGPTHRVPVRGLALPSARAFATPLGEVEVDRKAAAARAGAAAGASRATPRTRWSTRSRCSCRSCRPCSTTSASCRSPSATRRRTRWPRCIERLWGGPETLIVVSSDLSHYHRYADARAIDRGSGRGDPRALAGARPRAGLRRDADQRLAARARAGTASARAARPAQLGRHGGRHVARRRLRVVRVRRGQTRHGRTVMLGRALLALARVAIGARARLARVATGDRASPRSTQPGRHVRDADAWTASCAAASARSKPRRAARRRRPRERASPRRFATRAFRRSPRASSTRRSVEVSLLSAARAARCRATRTISLRAAAARRRRRGRSSTADHRATFLPQVWETLPEPRAVPRRAEAQGRAAARISGARDVNVSRATRVTKWTEREFRHERALRA